MVREVTADPPPKVMAPCSHPGPPSRIWATNLIGTTTAQFDFGEVPEPAL